MDDRTLEPDLNPETDSEGLPQSPSGDFPQGPPVSEETEEPGAARADLIEAFIRERTRDKRLASRFSLTRPPLGIPEKELDGAMEEVFQKEYGKNITELKGKRDRYYYCSDIMADNYARMLLLAEDKDIYAAIAATVRFDSQTYPRCSDAERFALPPLNLDVEKVKAAVKLMDKRPEYGDIKTITASDGKIFYYSEQFLSREYAQSLAEFEAVDWKKYP
jgi:hypothetical protein